ncbi:MAG: chemotaxis protein CheB, partial [Acidobacteriota bacterium]
SAGGVEAFRQLARELPHSFAAPVILVLHLPPESPDLLASILARDARVKVKTAVHGEKLENGVVYVAPPDQHVLVERDGSIRTSRGPRENRHRPAIDPLFRSAALAYGNRAVGVILTGNLDDGAAGLFAIKQRGGVAVVQDPSEALFPGMPQSALLHVDVDVCVALNTLVETLVRIVEAPPPPPNPAGSSASLDLHIEMQIAAFDDTARPRTVRSGPGKAFSCPDCGRELIEVVAEGAVRYHCPTGHTFSAEAILTAETAILDDALRSAIKSLEENARLSRRLAEGEESRGNDWMAARFHQKERDADERARVIHKFLQSGRSSSATEDAAPGSPAGEKK